MNRITLASSLDNLLDHAAEAARDIFEKRGEVRPFWIAQKRDGSVLPVAIPGFEDKDAAMAAIRIVFAQHRIYRYASMMESWLLVGKPGQSMADVLPSQMQVRDHPDRVEVVFIMAEDDRRCLMGRLEIVRPKVGSPRLKPFERMPTNYAEGRMFGLLPALEGRKQ